MTIIIKNIKTSELHKHYKVSSVDVEGKTLLLNKTTHYVTYNIKQHLIIHAQIGSK